MPPERQHNVCAAEAAVEEVTTAVNKLHAEVESLKSLKAALLKQTTTAAKAVALAAKQQQKAQRPAKPSKRNSKKRTAATAALSDEHTSSNGSSSDNDGNIDAGPTAAGSGSRSGKQGNDRTLDQVSGPTWRLFQALTLQTISGIAAGTATASGPAAGAAPALAGSGTQPGQPAPATSAPTDNAKAVPAGAAPEAAPAAAGEPDAQGSVGDPVSPQQLQDCAAAAAGKHAQPVMVGSSTMSDPTVCLQQLLQSCLQRLTTPSSSSGGGGSASRYDGGSSSNHTFTAVSEALSNPAQFSTARSLRISSQPAQQQQQQGLQDWKMLPDLDSLVLAEHTQAAVAEGAGPDEQPADSYAADPSQLQEPALSDASTAPAHKPTAAAPPPPPPPAAAAPLRQPFCISALLQQFDSMQCSPNSQHSHLSQPAVADAGLVAGRFMLLSTAAADADTLSGSQQQQQQMLLSAGEEVGLPSYMQKVIQQQPAPQDPSRPSSAAAAAVAASIPPAGQDAAASILTSSPAAAAPAAAAAGGEGGGGASLAHWGPPPISHEPMTQHTTKRTSPTVAAPAAAVPGNAVSGNCDNLQQQQHELSQQQHDDLNILLMDSSPDPDSSSQHQSAQQLDQTTQHTMQQHENLQQQQQQQRRQQDGELAGIEHLSQPDQGPYFAPAAPSAAAAAAARSRQLQQQLQQLMGQDTADAGGLDGEMLALEAGDGLQIVGLEEGAAGVPQQEVTDALAAAAAEAAAAAAEAAAALRAAEAVAASHPPDAAAGGDGAGAGGSSAEASQDLVAAAATAAAAQQAAEQAAATDANSQGVEASRLSGMDLDSWQLYGLDVVMGDSGEGMSEAANGAASAAAAGASRAGGAAAAGALNGGVGSPAAGSGAAAAPGAWAALAAGLGAGQGSTDRRQEEPVQQQQQQQPARSKVRSSYVPRFTKRKQNYYMLVDSLQQAQQDTAAAAAAAAASTAAADAAADAGGISDAAPAEDGSDSDLCVIEDADADNSDGCGVVPGRNMRTAAAAAAGAVPQLSRRRLSTSIVAAAASAGGSQAEGTQQDGADAAAAAVEVAGGSSVKRPLLPLLRRRGATAGTAAASQQQQQQQLGLPSQGADADTPAGNAFVGEEDVIEDESDSDLQQQQLAEGALGTGYRGTVPSLNRRKAPPANPNSSSQHRRPPTGPSGSDSLECSATSSSSWGVSSDDVADADVSDDEGGTSSVMQSPKAGTAGDGMTPTAADKTKNVRAAGVRHLRSATQSQQQPQSQGAAVQGSNRRSGVPAAAAAAAADTPLLLLQTSFRHATAWQYSSSNLLRLSQAGGKRRFKPVTKPEALLRQPAVTLKQLGHNMHKHAGGLRVPQHSTAATVLKALLGEDHFQQHYRPSALPPPQQAQPWLPQQQPQQWSLQQQWPGAQVNGTAAAATAAAPWGPVLTATHVSPTTGAPAAAAAAATGAAYDQDVILCGDDDAADLADFDDFDWDAVDALEAQHTTAGQAVHIPAHDAAAVAAAGGGGNVAVEAAAGGAGCGITTALADLRNKQQQVPAWLQPGQCQQQKQQQQGYPTAAGQAHPPGASWQQQQQGPQLPQPGHWQQQQQQGYPGQDTADHGDAQQQQQHWRQVQASKQQQQQQRPQDPITTALAGLLGLSDDEDDTAAAAAGTDAAALPTAGQQQQQQIEGHCQEPGDLVITGLFDTCGPDQPQVRTLQQRGGPAAVAAAPGGTASAHQAWPPAPQQQQWQPGDAGQQQWVRQQYSGGLTGQPADGVQLQQGSSWHVDQARQQQRQQQQGWPCQQQQQQQQGGMSEGPGSQFLSQLLDGWDADEAGLGGGLDVVMDGDDDNMQGLHMDIDMNVHNRMRGMNMGAGGAWGAAAAPGAAGRWGMQHPLNPEPAAAPAAAVQAWGGSQSVVHSQQQQQQQQGIHSMQAGPSQLQLLNEELEDLACQLVFLDEIDAAAEAGEPSTAAAVSGTTAQQNTSQLTGGGGGSFADAFGDAGKGCELVDYSEMPQTIPQGLSLAEEEGPMANSQGVLVSAQQQSGNLQETQQGNQPPPQKQQQQQQQTAKMQGAPAADSEQNTVAAATAAATATPAAGGSNREFGRPTGLRFGGLGSRLGTKTTTLAQMGPAERAAWVAAAKQRQQQLYGRFIELALQGQQEAAVGDHLGLQQLMELVQECIREELQGGSDDGSSGGSSGCGERQGVVSGKGGVAVACEGSRVGNKALNVMALIRKVQLRHQQMLLQQQQQRGQQQQQPGITGGKTADACLRLKGTNNAVAAANTNSRGETAGSKQQGGPAASAAAAGAEGKGVPLVAQQRLFVAFLNVAHQNNLAAAAGAAAASADNGQGGQAMGQEGSEGGLPGGMQAGGLGQRCKKRPRAGVSVQPGSTAATGSGRVQQQQQQQQGALAALMPGTKIFLT